MFDPGNGYVSSPPVRVVNDGGSGLVASGIVENGRIAEIVVENPGSGYSADVEVEVVPPDPMEYAFGNVSPRFDFEGKILRGNYHRRTASSDPDLVYQFQSSEDLSLWTTKEVPESVQSISADWERVDFEFSFPDYPVGFGRIWAAPSEDSSLPDGFVRVGAGQFLRGPASEARTVQLGTFYVERTEVTLRQWYDVADPEVGHLYDFDPAPTGKAPGHPVHSVNWYNAVKWCNARSELDGHRPVFYVNSGLTTVYRSGETQPFADWDADGYRLPTEAEWEKAARGGFSGRLFPWGETITHERANYEALGQRTWEQSETRGWHPDYQVESSPYTSPVGSFAANGYALYDIIGNVREWCWDWFSESYYEVSPIVDPRGPSSADDGKVARVTRGGGWDGFPGTNSRRGSQLHGCPKKVEKISPQYFK